MLSDVILLVLGLGLTLAFWDVARNFIAARRFNQLQLDEIAALKMASAKHDERLEALHSKLGAQQAAHNNLRGVRGGIR